MNGAAPASPPSASIANAGAQAPTPSHVHVFLLCSAHAWRGCPLLLPLHRRPDRLSTLHAKGLLSPRPARCQIRLGDPDDGASRPSRRRLRDLEHPPPRSPALRRLFRRPRISRPAPGQANRGDAPPPPRQAAAPNGAPLRRREPPPSPRPTAGLSRASRATPSAPTPTSAIWRGRLPRLPVEGGSRTSDRASASCRARAPRTRAPRSSSRRLDLCIRRPTSL